MNARGAKKFGDFWLLREACKTVMAPRCNRALFGEGAILLTERMLPMRRWPVCGSATLLRGELLDNAPAERGVAPGSGGSHG